MCFNGRYSNYQYLRFKSAFIIFRYFQASSDNLQKELLLVKQQYNESTQKLILLEKELVAANDKIKMLEKEPPSRQDLSNKLLEVKSELNQKSALLHKVKLLLQRAATKEKALLDEVLLNYAYL